MEPESRLLHYFLAVADELNFTRAAARLHIAQPSLSAQIRALESQLGVQLLRRSTRAVSLTEAGQALADRGPAALSGLQQAWEAARYAGRGETGTLRLAYPLSAGHDTAPRLVEALHDSYPSITVTTEVLPSPQVVQAVGSGRADAGIARAPEPGDGIRLDPLRRDPLGVIVPDSHPLTRRDVVDLAAVAGFPVVLHPRSANPSHYDFIVGLFTTRGLQPDLLERDIAFDLSHGFLTCGGSELVGRSSAEGLPRSLTWIPLTDEEYVAVALVLPAGPHAPVVDRFVQVARTHAADNDWLR
ncbi:LysR substrate-binding domain-containing protein [Flexivirga oryzae]|uniref:DNA-binding transcriptional LysR family regulator n=1 Tax=Flexivirga oryzae TaxID=1794944 RepID=A0A839N4F5_9MICO|nr:LysR substrate-binding domain-containing protein [Flexivirga oryzae]MBB2891639.1 DNA-binding transcriptional LysR family regulator [Flexivirga oryzae]